MSTPLQRTPTAEKRRWTLTDWSDDYNPKWAIGDGTSPMAYEHLEQVVVMPVAEHAAVVEEISRLASALADDLRTYAVRPTVADWDAFVARQRKAEV